MKLYEHQGKALFAQGGIAVPKGRTVSGRAELPDALAESGLPCVIKAQVLAGKRGKGGLIQFADTEPDARAKAEAILGDQRVKSVLVEEKLDIQREIYLSATVEPVTATVTLMACAEGGVDIEEVAATAPEKIVREQVNPLHGLMPFNVRNLVSPLGLDKEQGKAFGRLVSQLYATFRKSDALLAEINPVAVTGDGRVMAADAKVIVDDNALHRQPFERTLEEFENDVEYEAAQLGIPYLQFDGDIGLMCAGAGLTNTVFDLIHHFGGKPANFLEFGGPNYRRASEAMQLALKSKAKVLLIVTFGTIARADVMAEGIVAAMEQLKPAIPIVTAIRGTGEEEAADMLRAAGLDPLSDTEEKPSRKPWPWRREECSMSVFIDQNHARSGAGHYRRRRQFLDPTHDRLRHAGGGRRDARKGRPGGGGRAGVQLRPPGRGRHRRGRVGAVRAAAFRQGRALQRPWTRASGAWWW